MLQKWRVRMNWWTFIVSWRRSLFHILILSIEKVSHEVSEGRGGWGEGGIKGMGRGCYPTGSDVVVALKRQTTVTVALECYLLPLRTVPPPSAVCLSVIHQNVWDKIYILNIFLNHLFSPIYSEDNTPPLFVRFAARQKVTEYTFNIVLSAIC